jgi:hypothetical protein
MRRWNRKCGGYGQMDNWDGSKSNNTVIGCSFNGTTQLQARIQGHAQWIQQFLDAGWDGYLFTVMFNDLAGKEIQRSSRCIRW